MNVLRNVRAVVALGGAAVLLTSGGLVASVAASRSAQADPFTVRANGGLNVRSGPGLNSPIIGGLPPIGGTATATAELMIRTTSGAVFTNVKDVPRGTVLQLTGVTENGRTQIVFEGAVRWVNSSYLSGTSTVGKPPTSGLPAVVGQKYATTALILRSGSGDVFTSYGDAPAGARLDVTGRVENGRAQIVYNGAVRWVTAKYLSDTAPGPVGGGGSANVVGAAGLTANSRQVLAELQAKFPEIRSYGGVRPDSIPDHPSGRAIDAMTYTDAALGQRVADYIRANATRLNVEYVIHNQRIYSVARSSEGWRYMADRGSVTANHKDHVHITVR